MAKRFSILPSLNEDRVYFAEDFLARPSRDVLAGEGDGVSRETGNSLEVTETDPASLAVDVNTGACRADGWRFEVHTSKEEVSLDAADPNDDRIDRIIVRVRLGSSDRDVVLTKLTGTPAGSPSAPALTRDATTYEISLAQVLVGAGVTSVSDAEITDERGDTSVCGWLRAQDSALLEGKTSDEVGSDTTVLGAKSSNYTIQSSDLDAVLVVPIDISSGDVDITELALASMSGVVRYVIVNDAGQSSANKARVMDSGASEVWTGWQIGESIDIAYDGTNRRILSGDMPCPPARAVVAKTADQTISNNSTENIADANISEQIDQGSHFGSGAYTTPFAGRCRVMEVFVVSSEDVLQNYSIGGTTQINHEGKSAPGAVFDFDVASGAVVRPQATNIAGSNNILRGDAGEKETLMIFEMIERHR